jgi:hypothetical protein
METRCAVTTLADAYEAHDGDQRDDDGVLDESLTAVVLQQVFLVSGMLANRHMEMT